MDWKSSWYHSSPLTDSPAVNVDKGHFPLRCKLFRPWSTSHRVWKPVWDGPYSPIGIYFKSFWNSADINLSDQVYFLKQSTSLLLKQQFSFIFKVYINIQQNTSYAYFFHEKWQADCSCVIWCMSYALNYIFQFYPFCLGESLCMDETSLRSDECFRDLPPKFGSSAKLTGSGLQ